MDSTQKSKNQRQFILAAVAAICLLTLVFGAALFLHNDYEQHAAETVLNQLKVTDSVTLMETGKTEWHYLDSGEAPALDKNRLNWTLQGYDDSGWKAGKGSFGSVNGNREPWVNGAVPVNLLNHYTPQHQSVPVYYFRTEFNVDQLHDEWRLDGTVEFDDSLVLYINGRRVYTGNIPETDGVPAPGYGAIESVNRSLTERFSIDDGAILRKGKNVIAVEVHQESKSSPDVFFNFRELIYHEFQTPQGMPNAGTVILEPGVTERSVQVSWLVDEKNAYRVEYGIASHMDNHLYSNMTMEQKANDAGDLYCYTATLSHLQPDTKYVYRIVALSDFKRSNAFYFNTRELTGRFSFLFVGEPQLGAGGAKSDMVSWDATVAVGESIRPNTAFILSGGNQVESTDSLAAQNEYNAFRMPQTLKRIPIVTTRGSHEADAQLYDLQFKRRGENSVHDSYFTYNGALFVHLNSNSSDYAKHRAFLQKAIEETDPRWIIVNLYHDLFGVSPHTPDEKIEARRAEFAALFAAFNVDLVLSGQNHIYSRSYLMDGQTATRKDGGEKQFGETQYLSGGAATEGADDTLPAGTAPYSAKTIADQTPLISSIELSENELRINTYRVSDLQQVDFCVVVK
ncbi:MAG: metallophosphoesterase family protein [Oscillospiraceae bacterium]